MGTVIQLQSEAKLAKEIISFPLLKCLETKRDKIRMISLNASYQFYEEVYVAQELSMPQR